MSGSQSRTRPRRSPRCSWHSVTRSATNGRRRTRSWRASRSCSTTPHTEYLLGAPHDDAPPAGVAQLRYRYGLWRAGHDCLIEDLYVEPHARRSGLGRALVAHALERARERGCRRAELDVNERNDAALALYARFGFSAAENPYGGRDLYMRLHLE